MRRFLVFAFLALVLIPHAFPQDYAQIPEAPKPPEQRTPPAVVPEMQEPLTAPAKPILPAGTPVWLRLKSEVQVKKVKVGETVDFVLYHDLYYRDWLLAKAGTPVEATIEKVQKAKTVNRGSKLEIVFRGLQLLNGQVVSLNGETHAEGGIGVGGQIAGGLMSTVGECTGWPCLLFDVPAIPTAIVLGLASKGENKNIKVNSGAPAYIDTDTELDLGGLARPPNPNATGSVAIVRGVFGSAMGRDLYCNGIPLAHLDANHKLELELKPGFYRFSILPKKGYLQLFISADADVRLITDYEHVFEVNEHEENVNTQRVFGKRTEGDLFVKAKPVEKTDLYTTDCSPLAEQVDAPTSNGSADQQR